MTHLSENSNRLTITDISIRSCEDLNRATCDFSDVCVVRLPSSTPSKYGCRLEGVGELVASIAANLGSEASLVILGEVIDLVEVHASIAPTMRYQHWIAIKRGSPWIVGGSSSLPQYHFGALIHTRYKSSLHHAKTRIAYSYCPFCDRTTKDYGGKKHTYHEYGTLMSDVWRDITCDLDGDLTPVLERLADLFGIEPYRELRVLDTRPLRLERVSVQRDVPANAASAKDDITESLSNRLIAGDCIEQLQTIPDNSVDFAFADPPYNLGKKYTGYMDDLAIAEYFDWCDKWITELARVLRPGRTCAILNIPLWAIRHFLYMEKILLFQNWIVWNALGFPVRMVMPAHYSILCFSKGTPRELPGLTDETKQVRALGQFDAYRCLEPLAEGYCLRARCVSRRKATRWDDRGPLTDIWWDIHRLKHNSRRVDHPCQLPPQLMYRLISVFTRPEEVVLDCFNGAGTTTLTAHQLGRRYIGIELSEEYHNLTQHRHEEILNGLDPFRKADRKLTAKNSPVPRMRKQKYVVPKKTLQLEVKRVAAELGRLPSRDELIRYGKYPIKYYDEYFVSWGEVCAAARTTGMSETREDVQALPEAEQLRLLEKKKQYKTDGGG